MTVPDLADVAAQYSQTIVDAVRREYPNAPHHVVSGPADNPLPREAHPAFYGCYDWHSAVEMHWALVRMLRLVPDVVPAGARTVLAEHLTVDALRVEADYVRTHAGWERPYGYGWVLTLAAELEAWDDADARGWSAALRPLADVVTADLVEWLGRATYPQRGGMHQNSAFALTRACAWARARAADGEPELLAAIGAAAVRWFAADIDYPAAWEPSAADFLSPALAEAELVGALAEPPEEFPRWLSRFLPHLDDARPAALFEPVSVPDDTDGQVAHLHGLNLHRAHVFGLLADRIGATDPDDPRVDVLRAARSRHAAAALPHIVGDNWMTGHWLAAYAVLLLG